MGKLNFDPTTPVIILDVEIRGDSEVTTKRLALDTGATFVMIPWDVAELIGYTPELSKEKTDMITASGVESAPIITLKQMSVLGKTANNVQAIVHDLPSKSYVDGLLGFLFSEDLIFKLTSEMGISN